MSAVSTHTEGQDAAWPSFSIAVPARGQAEYIGTALRSLRAQRVPCSLSLLDATPDDSVQRAAHEAGAPIAYGYHRRDKGQAAAIQEGWDRTSGAIVAWLNADDYYFPDALSRVQDVFRRSPHVDVVFGHSVHVSQSGSFVGYFPSINADPRSLLRGCSISQPACFVRRTAMERVGGLNADLHFTMDWDLWVRLHQAGCSFQFIDAPLAAVRVHHDTKTMGGGRRRFAEIERLLRAHGVAAPDRWRMLVAFWRQHMRCHGSSPVLESVLDTLKAVEGRLRPARRLVIRGLECGTNRVERQCVVRLPWYGPTPQEVLVVADRDVSLGAFVNGDTVELHPAGLRDATRHGTTARGLAYRATVTGRNDQDLSLELQNAGGAWRLLGVAIS